MSVIQPTEPPEGADPDEERVVDLDDDAELRLPPPTLDPDESVEDDVDETELEERESAIEYGEIEP
ncbi:hypothetical protein [Microbacterium rhizosphaerae]|uniref:Sugar ABC transporter ATPase n=1 Tax=Microbacterium rhizosphaerae TaxID=1678237 RepID=A0ABZ0SKP1_9MICO|nr:hypothetical protein [Microbacterium rhizosphaerae]WPR88760.1 hypothetical protein SM116_13420 [Microbacterium rhizosphaerae]